MAAMRRWAAATVAALVMGVAAEAPGASGATAAASAPDQQARAIAVTELRGPDGQPFVEAVRINERGEVVGRLAVGAALWRRGVATAIAPGGAYPLDLSDRGHVAGTVGGLAGSLPFSWSAGVRRLLAVDGGMGAAWAVDDRGRVLGYRRACPLGSPWCQEPFETRVWDGDAVITPPALGPGEEMQPVDLNDRGQALVTVLSPSGDPAAALWRVGGGVARLPVPEGARGRGEAINDRGDVAGTVGSGDGLHAVVWRRGRLTDLGTLGGRDSWVGADETRARHQALSDRGHVVGASDTAGGDRHAFLWRGGEMIDLGTLGGPTSAATAVNSHGQVVGFSTTAAGEQHAFLWDRGRMVDLGRSFAGATSRALDINDRGQIVGEVVTEGPQGSETRAVLWQVGPGARRG